MLGFGRLIIPNKDIWRNSRIAVRGRLPPRKQTNGFRSCLVQTLTTFQALLVMMVKNILLYFIEATRSKATE